MLVILNDYPDFLSEFCSIFIEDISNDFVQLKNIFLSAFPKNLRVPTPYNEDLVDELENNPNIVINQIS